MDPPEGGWIWPHAIEWTYRNRMDPFARHQEWIGILRRDEWMINRLQPSSCSPFLAPSSPYATTNMNEYDPDCLWLKMAILQFWTGKQRFMSGMIEFLQCNPNFFEHTSTIPNNPKRPLQLPLPSFKGHAAQIRRKHGARQPEACPGSPVTTWQGKTSSMEQWEQHPEISNFSSARVKQLVEDGISMGLRGARKLHVFQVRNGFCSPFGDPQVTMFLSRRPLYFRSAPGN